MIHPTAIVDPSAVIGDNVAIGPYSVIGSKVVIGNDNWIGPHVVLNGPTEIGTGNRIFQFASVGEECQDLKYAGEPTKLVIGDNNVIREGATLHRGTVQDAGETRLGNHCLLMAYSHLAHDCVVGDHVIIANGTGVAGHCRIGDHAIVGGNCGVHQFCSIGAHAFVGAASMVVKDIPAYVTVQGNPASAHGINLEGLKRRGYSKDTLQVLRRAYKVVYRESNTTDEALIKLDAMAMECSAVKLFADSIRQSRRGIAR